MKATILLFSAVMAMQCVAVEGRKPGGSEVGVPLNCGDYCSLRGFCVPGELL